MSKKKGLRVLLQIVTVSTLLFVGWGLNDLGNFFAAPARAGLFLLLLVCNAAETLCLNAAPFATGRKLGDCQCWIPALSRLTMAFLCWFLPFGDHRGLLTFTDAKTLRYLGLVLFLGGGSVQLVARLTLGRQYSAHVTLQNDHQLVQNGIYTLIRHPIYLGLLLSMLGVLLVFRSWLVVPVLPLLTIFVGSRIRQEEKLLGEQFGAEFDSYRGRTKLLLPYLY